MIREESGTIVDYCERACATSDLGNSSIASNVDKLPCKQTSEDSCPPQVAITVMEPPSQTETVPDIVEDNSNHIKDNISCKGGNSDLMVKKFVLGKPLYASQSDIDIFKTAVSDKHRNLTFTKIVHDHRNDHNNIIGRSDDFVVAIRDDGTYIYWVPALEKEDTEMNNVIMCINKWSPITDGTHTEDVDMLKMLLSNIVMEYQEKL